MGFLHFLSTPDFWFSVLRGTTPVLFATLAANICTKCGILNIAIEGTMLCSALTGVLVSAYCGAGLFGLFMGTLAGISVGLIFSWFLGYLSLKLKANPVIAGIALNLIATGGTVFVIFTLLKDKNGTTALTSSTFPVIKLPLIDKIPFVGEFLNKSINGQNSLTYLGILFAILLWVLLFKTPLGLKIRSVGENRQAAESVGINVGKIQFISLTISGVMSALGGMFLSMGYLSFFNAGMTSGRGYLALATDGMSGSNPILGFFAALIYGFTDSVSNNIATTNHNLGPIFKLMPYVTLAILYAIYSYVVKKRNKEEFEF